ncbi:ASCH domain-containing protein [Archaeoglobus neptunius]|uniref:ASCH domain-containing protein n=1 Tax=Archaeoglobus neptunius TaxID=2798580 RepID=UPI0019255E76|nr:ASCH domain-containing protein [Archaeoglobus neptunius]
MKHLEFRRKYVNQLLSGKKRITIRNWTNLKEGDDVFVHCGGKIIGKAHIKSIRRKKVSELTEREAKLDGFRSLEEMLNEIRKLGYGDEIYVIEFDFEPLESVSPHNMYYGSSDLEEIARKSLEHLDLSESERRILETFLRYGSIRRAARKLGGSRRRGDVRKVLRDCYLRLKEKGLAE